MAMTRKHYKEVAEIIKSAREESDKNDLAPCATIRTVVDNLSIMFKRDNSNFDRDKFIAACGF